MFQQKFCTAALPPVGVQLPPQCICKAASKREQNQVYLNSAERKQARGLDRKITKSFGEKSVFR